jgi:hypothetical protein
MIRLAQLFVLVSLCACLESHSTSAREVKQNDCYTCHRADYEGTPVAAVADWTIPDHIARGYPTTCADCHVTSTWYSHPEALFPIQTEAHAAVAACEDCHNPTLGADAFGTNTQCVACHPASEPIVGGTLQTGHTGIVGFDYTTPSTGFTTNNFCLSCHPDGRSHKHPDDKFPQSHGRAMTCTDCHDRSRGPDTGGANVNCRAQGCHSNSHHPSDTAPQCLRCHPGGRGGGD